MKKNFKVFTITTLVMVIGLSMTACKETEENTPKLTGMVSISGTAHVGEMLTANTDKLSGNGTIAYQWKCGTAKIGTNSNTYVVQTEDLDSTITVTVTRKGYSGSVTSEPTAVVINQTPVATDFEIGNLTQTAGSVTAVTITPKEGKSTGKVTIYYNGSTTLPAAAGTYTVTFSVAAATGWDAVSGLSGGSLTINAKVNAQTPNITIQPANATVTFNTSHSLSVMASVTDGGSLSYKWYSNTSASTAGGTVITGATSTTYNPPTGTAGTYYYFAEVINTITDNGDGGIKTASVRSNVITLTVNTQVNAQIPNITIQPASATVTFNASHSLSVTASVTDGGFLSYQWYSNTSASNSGGTVITGATSATYNPPTDTVETYYYFVEVTNTIFDNGDGGAKTASIRSSAATLTVDKAIGATVNAPTLNTKTHNSITINLVTASNGQSLEYAINTSSAVPSGDWQTSTTFGSLNAGTTYYIFARAVGNNNYETGAASGSFTVTTLQTVSDNRIEYYWVNEHGSLVTTSDGAPTVTIGETLTITAQSAGYVVKQWHLNGMNTGQSGDTYNFTSTVTGKHTVGLFVEKDGKLYNTNITITVQ